MNYLLRTVHPDHTLEAAKELDTHLVDFVLRLTKCKGKYDGIDNDRERSRIVDQILLQISSVTYNDFWERLGSKESRRSEKVYILIVKLSSRKS